MCGALKIAAGAPALWARARTPAVSKPEPRALRLTSYWPGVRSQYKQNMAKTIQKPSEFNTIFGSVVKSQAALSEHTWEKGNGTAVTLKLFGQMTDEHDKPLKLSGEHEQRIALAMDAKGVQMATLEEVARECGAEIPDEVRALLERILNPAEFQQELIHAGLKKPSRKVNTKLKELVG